MERRGRGWEGEKEKKKLTIGKIIRRSPSQLKHWSLCLLVAVTTRNILDMSPCPKFRGRMPLYAPDGFIIMGQLSRCLEDLSFLHREPFHLERLANFSRNVDRDMTTHDFGIDGLEEGQIFKTVDIEGAVSSLGIGDDGYGVGFFAESGEEGGAADHFHDGPGADGDGVCVGAKHMSVWFLSM